MVFPIPDFTPFTPPGVTASTTPPSVFAPDGNPSGLLTMPATFAPSFIGLTGSGSPLNSLNANAADAEAGKIVQGTVSGQLKSYQVRAGTDAQDLPGIVRPANYDADNNAVVFVQL